MVILKAINVTCIFRGPCKQDLVSLHLSWLFSGKYYMTTPLWSCIMHKQKLICMFLMGSSDSQSEMGEESDI